MNEKERAGHEAGRGIARDFPGPFAGMPGDLRFVQPGLPEYDPLKVAFHSAAIARRLPDQTVAEYMAMEVGEAVQDDRREPITRAQMEGKEPHPCFTVAPALESRVGESLRGLEGHSIGVSMGGSAVPVSHDPARVVWQMGNRAQRRAAWRGK